MQMTVAASMKGNFNDHGNNDWLRHEEENRLIGDINKHYSSALEQRSSTIAEDSKKGSYNKVPNFKNYRPTKPS